MKKKEILVGLTVALALVLLFVGINFLKGVNVFKAANYYYATYTDVAGLSTSAPVTINGFKVGQVRSVEYQYDNPGHVVVEFSVDKALRIPQGSQAVITTDLLGTATIALRMGADRSAFYSVGDTVATGVDAGLMSAVSNDVMPAVSANNTENRQPDHRTQHAGFRPGAVCLGAAYGQHHRRPRGFGAVAQDSHGCHGTCLT